MDFAGPPPALTFTARRPAELAALDPKALGRVGEGLAANYLGAIGYTILERNWRCRQGEIDLIAEAPASTLVFAEVKTRRCVTRGTPADAVARRKVTRLRRLAGAWLAEGRPGWATVRLDVLAITVSPDGRIDLTHLQGVGA